MEIDTSVRGGGSSAAAAAPSAPSSSSSAAAAATSSTPSSLPASSRFAYVVNAHPPSVVTHTLVCNFTSANDLNLILIRSSRMEIYRVSESGIEPLTDVPLYARVADIKAFRTKSDVSSRLFICTERHKFFVLRWDAETREIVTLATGDSKLKIGRLSDTSCSCLLDPSNRWIGLHQYDGVFQLLSVDASSGALGSQLIDLKFDMMQVIQIAFLYKQSKPTLCVLANDSNAIARERMEKRVVKTYVYEASEKELKPSHVLNVDRCERGAAHMIPVTYGGVIIIAEETITYYPTGGRPPIRLSIPAWHVTAWCKVDYHRYLIADLDGGLHVLLLSDDSDFTATEQNHSQYHIRELKLEYLGRTSIAYTMTYVDFGTVMIGSIYGDSQLIKLHQTPVPVTKEEGDENDEDEDADADVDAMDTSEGAAASSASSTALASHSSSARPNFITIEHTFPNLGSIIDFVLLDTDRTGQCSVVTCSGAFKDASLRLIRNGIGVREEATIELPGITGVWSLKRQARDQYDTFLVQAFATETRILALEQHDSSAMGEGEDEGEGEMQLAEVEISGFDASQRTLFCANMAGNALLQVTATSCRIVDSQSRALMHEWRMPSSSSSNGSNISITVATANESQVMLAAGKQIMLLTLKNNQLQLEKQTTMDEEVSCIDMTPFGNGSSVQYAAVCLWRDFSLRVLNVSTLSEVGRERLGETVARSVRFARFTPDTQADTDTARPVTHTSIAYSFLLCGLGDGNIVSFEFDPNTASITGRKKMALGTTGIELRSFYSRSELHLFACCDRPSVISCVSGKLSYGPVNLRSVSHVSPFHAPLFHDCLALVTPTHLTIGRIDDMQKLHIRRIKTGGGEPRRIAHQQSSGTLVVAMVEPDDEVDVDGGELSLTGERSKLKLFDVDSFSLLDELRLERNEEVLAIQNLHIDTNANAMESDVDAAAAASSSFSSPSSLSLQEVYVVGTAFINPDEPEPSAGRLLVLQVDNSSGRHQIHVLTSAAIKGGVNCVAAIQGRIVAGVNSKVVIYRCVRALHSASSGIGEFRLEKECDYLGSVFILNVKVTRDQQYILIQDLMKSVSMLIYRRHANTTNVQTAHGASSLEEVCRDYEAHWLTAVDSFTARDDVFIAADQMYNLLTIRRNVEGATDEDRSRMEAIGRWHAGDQINKIAQGALIMQLPTDSDPSSSPSSSSSSGSSMGSSGVADRHVPSHVFGGVNGSLGVVAPLSHGSYKFFARLEEELERTIRGVGGLSHRDWRAYHDERREEDSMGVIDGELVQCFLHLSHKQQETIANKIGYTISECMRRVEDAARIH